MNFPDQAQLTGGLYSPVAGEQPVFSEEIPGLTVADAGAPGWKKLQLRSPKPLTTGEPLQPEYLYYFLLRRSGQRFLLVASHGGLDDHLIARSPAKTAAARPVIDVPRLVVELTDRPGRYVMSALWARVDGFGQTLRSMSLYGTDLASSALFANLVPQIVPHRVQLRDVATRVEILSVSSRGEVGFTFSGVRSLQAIDRALAFLSQRGYLDWVSLPITDGEQTDGG